MTYSMDQHYKIKILIQFTILQDKEKQKLLTVKKLAVFHSVSN